MPPVNILIKPSSGNCNLRCKYCFYCDEMEKRETANYGFMSEETLEILVKRVLEFADGSCGFAFQGGEPTLVGLDFYRKLLEYEQKYNIKMSRFTILFRQTAMVWGRNGQNFWPGIISWWAFLWTELCTLMMPTGFTRQEREPSGKL